MVIFTSLKHITKIIFNYVFSQNKKSNIEYTYRYTLSFRYKLYFLNKHNSNLCLYYKTKCIVINYN